MGSRHVAFHHQPLPLYFFQVEQDKFRIVPFRPFYNQRTVLNRGCRTACDGPAFRKAPVRNTVKVFFINEPPNFRDFDPASQYFCKVSIGHCYGAVAVLASLRLDTGLRRNIRCLVSLFFVNAHCRNRFILACKYSRAANKFRIIDDFRRAGTADLDVVEYHFARTGNRKAKLPFIDRLGCESAVIIVCRFVSIYIDCGQFIVCTQHNLQVHRLLVGHRAPEFFFRIFKLPVCNAIPSITEVGSQPLLGFRGGFIRIQRRVPDVTSVRCIVPCCKVFLVIIIHQARMGVICSSCRRLRLGSRHVAFHYQPLPLYVFQIEQDKFRIVPFRPFYNQRTVLNGGCRTACDCPAFRQAAIGNAVKILFINKTFNFRSFSSFDPACQELFKLPERHSDRADARPIGLGGDLRLICNVNPARIIDLVHPYCCHCLFLACKRCSAACKFCRIGCIIGYECRPCPTHLDIVKFHVCIRNHKADLPLVDIHSLISIIACIICFYIVDVHLGQPVVLTQLNFQLYGLPAGQAVSLVSKQVCPFKFLAGESIILISKIRRHALLGIRRGPIRV